MSNHKRNTTGLIPFQKGQSGNLNGRPRKIVTQLTGIGYKKSEITDTLANLLALNLDELKKVFENPDSTILERTIANALFTGLKKGSLYNVMEVITRIIGKPREEVEVKQEINMKAFTVSVVKVDTPLAGNEQEVNDRE